MTETLVYQTQRPKAHCGDHSITLESLPDESVSGEELDAVPFAMNYGITMKYIEWLGSPAAHGGLSVTMGVSFSISAAHIKKAFRRGAFTIFAFPFISATISAFSSQRIFTGSIPPNFLPACVGESVKNSRQGCG